MATTKSGGVKTGFSGFGSNVVKSVATTNKQANLPATNLLSKGVTTSAPTSPSMTGAVGSAFKSGVTNLTNAGSGGAQGAAEKLATAPTSYLAGTTITANTPIINPQIGINSLSSTTSTAGSSPTLAASAPSTGTYGTAIQGSVATGANPSTGLYDTSTINADGTSKVTATTGETVPKLSAGEQFLKDNGIPTLEKPKSITDEYYSSPAYKAQLAAQQQMNATQNAINAVTTRVNTDLANLRGVGAREGVTEAVYGQQVSEITREANNQLLPLQAQLAADQGNLELATNTLNTWATMRQKDLDNEYNYKKSLRDELVKFATDAQKARLDAAQKKADQQFELQKLAIQFDYQKKLKSLESSIGTMTPLQVAGAQTNIQSISQIPQMKGIGSAVGTSILTRQPSGFWGTVGKALTIAGLPGLVKDVSSTLTGETQNFISSVEQLRTSLTLDNLVNAKARGATFGALSDAELNLLNNSATKIGSWAIKDKQGNVKGYNIDENTFKKEIDKINNAAKLDYILKGGDPLTVDVQKLPDGTYWTTNSDGSLTRIR